MSRLDYPAARAADVVDDYHGTKVADPYRWLEDADAPETRAWIAAQNDLTQGWLAGVANRDDIRRRIEQLTDHPRAGAPWRRAGRWFQLRNTGLQDQDVLWTMDAPDAQGRVLLDPNTLSSDGTVAVTGLAVSDDGTRLAYATSASGSDWMTWRVRDVGDGSDADDVVEWSKFSPAAWAPDGSGFWYAAYDPPAPGQAYEQANRNQRLCFHRLGAPADGDTVVYARPDQPEWGFLPEVTADGAHLVVTVWHGTDPRNRVYVAPARPDAEPGPLLDDFDAAYELAGSDGSVLYFRTDLDAPRGRVIAVDLASPGRQSWREVVAESGDTLERAKRIGDRLLGVYLHDASHRLRWFSLAGVPLGEIELPGLGSVDAVTGREGDRDCCFTVTTFTMPTQVLRHDLDTGATAVLHDGGGAAGARGLRTTQGFVRSTDGAAVPVFLVTRDDVTPDGDRPVWLYGYGGFQVPITPMYKPEWVAWVELGGVLAVANLRGGGEYGKPWHDAGRLGSKQQVFDDAVAVTEWLNGPSGWSRPGRVAIHGRSNGGLLAAACLTQRPELFGAAVPEVGVLDMLRFHTFTIGWGWTSDYGSADDPEQFAWLYAYSPLHRIRPGTEYPPTLLTTGDHDDRVVPGHTLKFAAALQAAQGGAAPVLLRVETDAGHGVGKPVGKLVAERADVVAFLVRALEVAGNGGGTAQR